MKKRIGMSVPFILIKKIWKKYLWNYIAVMFVNTILYYETYNEKKNLLDC